MEAVLLLLIVAFLVGAGIHGLVQLLNAMRVRHMLARLPAPTPPEHFDATLGTPVVVRGQWRSGPVATAFGGGARRIEEAHLRAEAVDHPPEMRIAVAERELVLAGPVQVILGSSERRALRNHDDVSLRTIATGDDVLAHGVLRHIPSDVGDASYRDHARVYELTPPPDAAWLARPITVYCARKPLPIIPVLILGASALALLGVSAFVALVRVRAPAASVPSAVPAGPPPRPPCVNEVAVRLDAFDFKGAAAIACDDARARGEIAWASGRVADAAREFATARERRPNDVLTVSEVEAAIMTDHASSGALVKALKAAWYKGPEDESQRTMDCIERAATGHERPYGIYCGPITRGLYGQNTRNLHSLPAYALHDPIRYWRAQPIVGPDTTFNVGCGTLFRSLEDAVSRECTSSIDAMRAVAGAVLEDRELLYANLARLEAYARSVDKTSGEPVLAPEYDFPYGSKAQQLTEYESTRSHLIATRNQTIAVGVAAAWFAHDAEWQKRLLPWMRGHERGIFDEHQAMVAGTIANPIAQHSPSDYSGIEMSLFEAAKGSPESFAAAVRERKYTGPVALTAMVASRPAHREALRAWVRTGFPPPCRTCGIHAMLTNAVERRELARLVGEEPVRAEMSDVVRGLASALLQGGTYPAVTSLEGLIAARGW